MVVLQLFLVAIQGTAAKNTYKPFLLSTAIQKKAFKTVDKTTVT